MSFEYKITLFTPTYNRAYILDKLYRSIQRQTFRDFEWPVFMTVQNKGSLIGFGY